MHGFIIMIAYGLHYARLLKNRKRTHYVGLHIIVSC